MGPFERSFGIFSAFKDCVNDLISVSAVQTDPIPPESIPVFFCDLRRDRAGCRDPRDAAGGTILL